MILGIALIIVGLLGATTVVVMILYPCGDELDHYTRHYNGKGNPCRCHLAQKYSGRS